MISPYALRAHMWCRDLYIWALLFTNVKLLWRCARQVCGSVFVWRPVLRPSPNSAASWGARVALGGWSLAYVPGVSVFTFYPVLSLGECKFIWVVALTAVAAMYCFSVSS